VDNFSNLNLWRSRPDCPHQRSAHQRATARRPPPTGGPTTKSFYRAKVQVRPDAAEQFATHAAWYQNTEPSSGSAYGDAPNVTCCARGSYSSCSSNILIGMIWVSTSLVGIDIDTSTNDAAAVAQVAPLISSIVATVTDAPAQAPAWTVPATTVTLPADCTGYASADEVRAATGYSGELSVGPTGGGGWSPEAGAGANTSVDRCAWNVMNADINAALVSALPGGAWAFDESVVLMKSAGLSRPLSEPIAGVDLAAYDCAIFSESFTLDTVIGENWVQFTANQPAGSNSAQLQNQLVQLAAGAAAHGAA